MTAGGSSPSDANAARGYKQSSCWLCMIMTKTNDALSNWFLGWPKGVCKAAFTLPAVLVPKLDNLFHSMLMTRL